jgi:hypothetical protein
MWHRTDVSFDLVDDLTSSPVVTISIATPVGVLRLMAEPEMIGRTLRLRRVHVQDAYPNAVGPANWRLIAAVVMERMNVDGLVVEGALRTIGANPGRRPGVLRFTRRLRSSTVSGSCAEDG